MASVVELRSLPPRVCGCELNLVLRNLVSVQSHTFVDQGRLITQPRAIYLSKVITVASSSSDPWLSTSQANQALPLWPFSLMLALAVFVV